MNRSLSASEREGAITLYRFRGRAFTEKDFVLADGLAKQMAPVIMFSSFAEHKREAAVNRERTAELSRANHALRNTLALVATSPCPQDFLCAVITEVVRQLRGDVGQLVLYDPTAHTLTQLALVNRDTSIVDPTVPAVIPAAQLGALPLIMALDEPRYFDSQADAHLLWPGTADFHQKRGCRSAYVVPLRFAGQFAGFLACSAAVFEPLSNARREVVMALAQQATLSVALIRRGDAQREAAVLIEREQAAQVRAEELEHASETLQQIIDAVSKLESLDAFIPHALDIVAKAFGVGNVGYFEHPDSTIRLRYLLFNNQMYGPSLLAEMTGEPGAIISRMAKGILLPAEYPEADFHSRIHPAMIHHRTARGWESRHKLALRLGWDWELGIPLVLDGVADGAIAIYRPDDQPFNAADISLAQTLVKQIALGIQASRIADREREGAIAREQEVAARCRAAEFANANQLLRECALRLSRATDVPAIAAIFMTEAMKASSACGGALFLLEMGGFRLTMLAQDGEQLQGPALDGISCAAPVFEASKSKTSEHFRKIREGNDVWRYPAIVDTEWVSEAFAYHVSQRHQAVWDIPLAVDGQVLGYLALAFRGMTSPVELIAETVRALANQVAVAMELTSVAARLRQSEVRAAVSDERSRLARGIHDSLAQSFTSIAMQAETLLSSTASDHHWSRTLRRISETARHGVSEARTTALALLPLENRMSALDQALEGLADRSTIQGRLRCLFCTSGTKGLVPIEMQDALLRIAQEAVNNAAKHAKGSTIRIRLSYLPEAIQLEVVDDGEGLHSAVNGVGGLGLKGMRLRAEALGGTFATSAVMPRGTAVVVTIPLPPAAGLL